MTSFKEFGYFKSKSDVADGGMPMVYMELTPHSDVLLGV